jgi:hypothetical protein
MKLKLMIVYYYEIKQGAKEAPFNWSSFLIDQYDSYLPFTDQYSIWFDIPLDQRTEFKGEMYELPSQFELLHLLKREKKRRNIILNGKSKYDEDAYLHSILITSPNDLRRTMNDGYITLLCFA